MAEWNWPFGLRLGFVDIENTWAQSTSEAVSPATASVNAVCRTLKELFMIQYYTQKYKHILVVILFGSIAALLSCGGSAEAQKVVPPATIPATSWSLTWSDEFSGADGSLPDAAKWQMQTGGGGWGNNELETYTTRAVNASQRGGNLEITARAEHFTGTDGITREYTSARLQTKGLFSQTYGRFEARIKMPKGQGVWPAFWMLGSDIDTAGWPTSGEIDIMETIGSQTDRNVGSLHGPGYSGSNPLNGIYTMPSGTLDTDFHVYAVEWEPTTIRFYVDDHLFETRSTSDVPAGSRWVFDHPFFMLLNVAVGGNWPGSPDSSTVLPQTMLVDYVRVYKKT
jgi:beta-glucanase (GH16 family)